MDIFNQPLEKCNEGANSLLFCACRDTPFFLPFIQHLYQAFQPRLCCIGMVFDVEQCVADGRDTGHAYLAQRISCNLDTLLCSCWGKHSLKQWLCALAL